MPYFNIDPEAMEEWAEMGAPSDFEASYYEAAEAVFNFEQADELVRLVRRELLEKGFSEVRCHYDGGYDEGFAYFDEAVCNGSIFSSDELTELLSDGPLPEAAGAMYHNESYPEAVRRQMMERFEAMPKKQRVANALEEFVIALANELLGEGFGTGEYELRGRFQVDLASGQVVDIEEPA